MTVTNELLTILFIFFSLIIIISKRTITIKYTFQCKTIEKGTESNLYLPILAITFVKITSQLKQKANKINKKRYKTLEAMS